MKKAQSAMEYLMTYGWAILIVIIVAAALFALGVFNPSTYTGRAATGFGGLGTPSDWQYTGTSFIVKLSNQVGQDINVTSVASTGCTPDTTPTDIAAGETGTFTLTCTASKSAGSSFSQAVTVEYSVAGGLPRSASGTLTGTAT
jgi:hypothetical protein